MQLDIHQQTEFEQTTTDLLTHANEPETELHFAVFGIVAGCYLSMLGVFWWVFSGSSQTIFMIVICAIYFAMYFGTPYVLADIAKQSASTLPRAATWSNFLRKPFATNTGLISGREAVLQICLIPICLLFATIIIGFIIRVG